MPDRSRRTRDGSSCLSTTSPPTRFSCRPSTASRTPAPCSAVDYQWTGSETSDVAQMVNAMNTAIAGKADAIAVCLVDPKGFDRPAENALAAGIPVFSYNANSKTNKRLAYIGQDLFLSGQMMGERIVKLVGSGKVAIFIATPGQLNLQPRDRRRDGRDQEIGRRTSRRR